jgi:signal transduction histidine kinase
VSRTPIRLRIAFLATAAAAVTTSLIGFFALAVSEAAIRSDFDVSLEHETAQVSLAVQGGLALDTFRHYDPDHGIRQMGLFDEAGNIVDRTEAAPPLPATDQTDGVFFEFEDQATGEKLRGLSRPVVIEGHTNLLVLAIPTSRMVDRSLTLSRTVAAVAGVMTVVGGVGAYILTGLVLSPIERLRRSAEDLAEEPAGRRLDVPPAHDEVRHLAETLNVGLERIDEMMNTQRRFLAEASHELRTPIARLRAEIDLARRPTRTHEELVAALAGLDQHADHLTSLANNFLARMTPQTTPGELGRPVSVNQILANLRHVATDAESIQVDVSDEVGTTSVVTEPAVLVGVLSNMVGNAFRHGALPVELTVERIEKGLAFAVRDCGPGIPEEVRELVLQPYGRGQVPTSGSGLGLSIVHEFATSRGGELVIEDADPGCRIVLRLPFEFVTG